MYTYNVCVCDMKWVLVFYQDALLSQCHLHGETSNQWESMQRSCKPVYGINRWTPSGAQSRTRDQSIRSSRGSEDTVLYQLEGVNYQGMLCAYLWLSAVYIFAFWRRCCCSIRYKVYDLFSAEDGREKMSFVSHLIMTIFDYTHINVIDVGTQWLRRCRCWPGYI